MNVGRMLYLYMHVLELTVTIPLKGNVTLARITTLSKRIHLIT